MRIDSGQSESRGNAAAIKAFAPGAFGKQQMAKLADGARQFEAMMLQEMLKPLNFGGSPDAEQGESSGGAADTIRGFGTEAVAKAIASGKGFGIAQQIVRKVTHEHDAVLSKQRGAKVL